MLAATLVPWAPALADAGPPSDGPPGAGPGGAGGPGGRPESSFSIGVGGLSLQKAYAGIGRDNKVLPVIRFENRYVHLFGPRIGLKLPALDLGAAGELKSSLIGRYDPSGYKANDAPILNGMGRRKGGFQVGAEVEWENPLLTIKGNWLADASGHSKGQQAAIRIERAFRPAPRLMLTPRVEAIWHDRKYVDYYYGVREAEARPGRPAYQGSGGTGAELGLHALYLFDARQAVMVDFSVTRIAKTIRDSPLVDRSTENRLILAYLYRLR